MHQDEQNRASSPVFVFVPQARCPAITDAITTTGRLPRWVVAMRPVRLKRTNRQALDGFCGDRSCLLVSGRRIRSSDRPLVSGRRDGEANEIGNGFRAGLFHDGSTMVFHRPLANPQIRGDDLVRMADDD